MHIFAIIILVYLFGVICTMLYFDKILKKDTIEQKEELQNICWTYGVSPQYLKSLMTVLAGLIWPILPFLVLKSMIFKTK